MSQDFTAPGEPPEWALRLHRWVGSANDDVTDRSESMSRNPAIELRDPGGSLLSGYCDSYLNDSWILVR